MSDKERTDAKLDEALDETFPASDPAANTVEVGIGHVSHDSERRFQASYVPSPRDWVREQVELYESSGGKKGTTLRDTGLPVIIVTNMGNKTGMVRKTPLMRVVDGPNYVLVGSQGGAPTDPAWVHNLRAHPLVEVRDGPRVQSMNVREIDNRAERTRLWALAVAAYPPYEEYQTRTTRTIPVFLAEPAR